MFRLRLAGAAGALVVAVAMTASVSFAVAPARAQAAGAQGYTQTQSSTVVRTHGHRVLLAFLPVLTGAQRNPFAPDPDILTVIDQHPQLALGLLGATQGGFRASQALLDMGQGTRVSGATYRSLYPPSYLTFYPTGHGGLFVGWLDQLDRVSVAPADIVPGLLGSSVPGGAAYAGVTGREQLEALPAANEQGRIPDVSIGPSKTLATRARLLLARHGFVVAGLPTGLKGQSVLNQLLAQRTANELLIVVQTPPPYHSPQLLPIGIAGLGPARGLTSASTHLSGIVAGIDVAPTVLTWLHVPIPDAMKGEPITITGSRDAQALMTLSARLRTVDQRRFPVLETALGAWLLILLAFGVVWDRRGSRRAIRIGALAMLWLLALLLVTAALSPSKSAEIAYIVGGAFGLGLLTDLLVPWPRAPAVPGLVTIVAYVVDLFFHSHLIVRSILGPNPRLGSRYYGISNELEAALPVLLFIGLAALMGTRGRSRRHAAVFAGSGLVLGAAFGSARLGADVGGVITVGAGAAVATLMMLPGRISWRGVLIVLATPIVALFALAALDLATGGNGHFTRTVLHAHGKGALTDIVVRRYHLAYNVLRRGLMPYATAIAVLALAYGIRFRARLLASMAATPAWNAALGGSIAAGIAGSLANDSGPELLVIATFAVAVVYAYVRGDPRLAEAPGEPTRAAS